MGQRGRDVAEIAWKTSIEHSREVCFVCRRSLEKRETRFAAPKNQRKGL